MRNILSFILVCLLGFSCETEVKETTTANTIQNRAQAEILTTVNNVYNNIIVDADIKPDFRVIKDQFTINARLGYIREDSLILKDSNDYFDTMEGMLSENKVEYLKEWEIQGETKLFGNIAQRTSLYGVHFNTKDSLAEKGIINFQLVKIKDQWKILSMIWESEKRDLTVPGNYFE
ncbi:hypothetical protein [Zeaxanthinibacter enoshimensis]|uniref:hypothetical protein n=1 Tax=Zeaxanthinibacter enoshimensis TaxID=392009 RepID=UPI003562BDDD